MTNKNVKIDIDEPILKQLLRDGFTLPHDSSCGLIVLLRGKPGAGKSTLALQILDLLKSDAKRIYGTFEQSKNDLQFKIASMLVARAIMKSRSTNDRDDKFVCDSDKFFECLQGRLRSTTNRFRKSVLKLLQEIDLPLFDEPNEDIRKACSAAEYALSELVNANLKMDRIVIEDITTYMDGSASAASTGSKHSQPIMARRFLEGVLFAKKSKGTIEENERSKKPIVVIDGLSLLQPEKQKLLGLENLLPRLRNSCQLGILVYEPNEEESTSLDHHADMVIDLAHRSIEHPLSYLIHEMTIRKARYQDAALGQHQFKIRRFGLAFFPSLHFQVHHYNYMDLELIRSGCDPKWKPTLNPNPKGRIPCEQGSIIDMIFNPQAGDTIVLLGPRNTFKTQLSLDFLVSGWWGCFKKRKQTPEASTLEKGLLISLIDNSPDIERGLMCPWKKSQIGIADCDCRAEEDNEILVSHACAFCQRPGCITPAEFFHYVKQRIEILVKDRKADTDRCRLAFWDLTQMDYRFPLFREDKMFLPALMDMFKTKKLISLLMGAGNAENTPAASAMADHVLFCWRSAKNYGLNGVDTSGKACTSSLMLYVDRTSASSKQSGKALYCIPIIYDDKSSDDKLLLPRKKDILARHLIPLSSSTSSLSLEDYDREMIRKITDMQGVG